MSWVTVPSFSDDSILSTRVEELIIDEELD